MHFYFFHQLETLKSNRFGSPVLTSICNQLKPKKWYSGHCHVDFKSAHPSGTKFRACDKVNDRRSFLAVEDIEASGRLTSGAALTLRYDLDWLSILSSTLDLTWKDPIANLFSYHGVSQTYNLTPKGSEIFNNMKNSKKIAFADCKKRGLDFKVPEFKQSDPGEKPDPNQPNALDDTAPEGVNQQTLFLLQILNCLVFHTKNFLYVDPEKPGLVKRAINNSEEIDLGLSDCEDPADRGGAEEEGDKLAELKAKLGDEDSDGHSDSQRIDCRRVHNHSRISSVWPKHKLARIDPTRDKGL